MKDITTEIKNEIMEKLNCSYEQADSILQKLIDDDSGAVSDGTYNSEGTSSYYTDDDICIEISWVSNIDVGYEIIDYSIDGCGVSLPSSRYPKTQTIYKIVPKEDNEITQRKYKAIKDMDWFVKLEKDINYDFHFEPTNKTKEYYKKRVDAIGGKITSIEIEVD